MSEAVGHDEGGNPREQDRFLPIANISRIMKRQLPSNAKIAKDAKETVQECVSEFISFITSECVGVVLHHMYTHAAHIYACFRDRASDKCQREKRKTINGDDLLWAMSTLGFEDYVEPLRLYLLKYREVWALFLGCIASHAHTAIYQVATNMLMLHLNQQSEKIALAKTHNAAGSSNDVRVCGLLQLGNNMHNITGTARSGIERCMGGC